MPVRLVASGATLTCSLGMAPSLLLIATGRKRRVDGQELATVADHEVSQFTLFGMCTSPQNPLVMATNAPAPCRPPIINEWQPGARNIRYRLGGNRRERALTDVSFCTCIYSGLISITNSNCRLRVEE